MDQIHNLIALIEIKDIALLGVGAIFSFLAKHVPAFISNYSQISQLLGTWHTYHWSRADGDPTFRYTIYKIERRIYGLQIYISDTSGAASPYRGAITFDGNDILIEAKGLRHSEKWSLRLNNPIAHEDTKMIGLLLAVDFDRDKYSAIKLCCRRQREIHDAQKIISDMADFLKDESALRVKRSNSNHNKIV